MVLRRNQNISFRVNVSVFDSVLFDVELELFEGSAGGPETNEDTVKSCQLREVRELFRKVLWPVGFVIVCIG